MYKVKDDIYWVGHIDWDLRNFHGYSTPHGSTYNAYLIVDEKPVLIDTVKDCGTADMLKAIREVIDPKEIKYIISNHTEMDHSGAIDQILQYCPDAEVVCTAKAIPELKKHFKKDWKFKAVKTGDVLDIGKRKLVFNPIPMVHWPESMATYSEYDRVLFPNDAFGQHYASQERFADEMDSEFVFREAAKYYGNIVLPYGAQVLKVLDAVASLAVDMICPSHGLIWRNKEDIEKLINLYKKWASHSTDKEVVVAYDTMWHSTEKMATRLYELIAKENIPVKIFNLQDAHISDIVTDILSAKVFLLGTPILNNHMLPTVAGLLMYLKGLRPKNRYALSFGSYGWAKAGFKEVDEFLTAAGFVLMGEGQYVQFVPEESELDQLSAVIPLLKEKLALEKV